MDTQPDKTATETTCSSDYVQMYYKHQYERMGQLEHHALTVSNLVITLTAAGFAFGFSKVSDLAFLNGVGLPLVLVVANVFAIAYGKRCVDFISVHDKRAKETLHRYAPDLWHLDAGIPWPKRPWTGGRMKVHSYLHLLLIVAALLPLVAYLCR